MTVIDIKHRTFEEELARIRPLLAVADEFEQALLLDEAFGRAGLDPTWAQWRAWARAILPAYRAGEESKREEG